MEHDEVTGFGGSGESSSSCPEASAPMTNSPSLVSTNRIALAMA